MEQLHEPHPWVAAGRGRIRFGVTQATWETSPDWDTRVAFVRAAEALGFDSYWAADHPTMQPDCFTTLAGSYVVAGWLPRAVSTYWGQPPWVGAALFAGVWLVTVAPAVVVFTLCYRAAARRHGAPMAFVAGAACRRAAAR